MHWALLEIYKNPLIYFQIGWFQTHLLWIYIYIYIYIVYASFVKDHENLFFYDLMLSLWFSCKFLCINWLKSCLRLISQTLSIISVDVQEDYFFVGIVCFCFILGVIYIYIRSDLSILLYGCTTWTLTKLLERRLDGNYTRMLRAVLNKSWRQHPTRPQLYGHLPPITKTIQVRRTRHAGHCWRSKDELISDVFLWTPTHGCARVGRPARTYIQQLCEDTGCNPEDLPEAMNDREKWREMVRDVRADGATWWWWWYIYIYIYIIKQFIFNN